LGHSARAAGSRSARRPRRVTQISCGPAALAEKKTLNIGATVRKEEATRSDLACTLLRPAWAAMSLSRLETVDLDRLLNRVL
jgi:hypothetical protein